MAIPVEAFAPFGAVAVAVIGLLATMLVRERKRNGNPGMPMRCTLASEEWKSRFKELHDDLGRIETGQERMIDALNKANTTLAVIKDRR